MRAQAGECGDGGSVGRRTNRRAGASSAIICGVCASDPSVSAVPETVEMQQGSARIVLLRILGDLVHPTSTPVPTMALLTVLSDAGFGTHAARQAISRCARMGAITGEKDGRSTRWLLTDAGQDLVVDGNARARQLGAQPGPWDGRWLTLAVSVPHERRVIRQKLYRTLSWEGCGSPVPGIWISAHPDRRERISVALERFGLDQTAVSFIGEASGIGLSETQLVSQAWDLDAVSRSYSAAVSQFDAALEPTSGPHALRLLLHVDEVLQRLVSQDPCLPSELCPGWTGRQDATRLLSFRDVLLVPARAYWDEVLRR
ncbi:PaaX family transcriptional regulator C-terminal domain-containing protein [Rhodococcus sp. LB1]|uniref:PaaX family transcriptional regulator C-terminal domain-containing protein n=1 Tax=Rhodococcus sp. LB1 TaxID=1807499 RepID=UPI0009EDD6BD